MTIDAVVSLPTVFISSDYNPLYRLNTLPIKAVAFDVWNTLLDIGIAFNQLAYVASTKLGIDMHSINKSIIKAYNSAKRLRRYSNLDGFQIVVESQKILANELGIDVDTVMQIIDEAFSTVDINSLPFNDTKEILKILRRVGFKMGIIGNTLFWNSIYTRRILKQLEILDYMDVVLFSDELRINKPDRRIFLQFSKEIDIEPDYIAYVGDSIVEDVGGALSTGMKAIYVDRNRREKIILKDIGIAIITNLLEVVDAIDAF
ncbi:MAG: HAD family hydrolase [Ignisphaera sp.]|uniref:HAD family hydrolase n=1 Tax=Ignisphaera aggregans TaxID=334771 RepID=A0A7J3I8A7_9CREN